MYSRYLERIAVSNDMKNYRENVQKGNTNFVHYTTPFLKVPNKEQKSQINIIYHTWAATDRFYKLAHQYYLDPKLWWVIAKFNLVPTESIVQIGDVLEIPTPVDVAISLMRG